MEAYAGGRQKTSHDNFDDLDLEGPSTKGGKAKDPEELDDNDLRHRLITPLGQQKRGAAIKINLHTDSRKLAETRPNMQPIRGYPPTIPNFLPPGFTPIGLPPPPVGMPVFNPFVNHHLGSPMGHPLGGHIGLNLPPPGFPLNPLPPPGVLPSSAIVGPSPAEIALAEQNKRDAQQKTLSAAAEKQKELRKALAIQIVQGAGPDRHSYRGALYKQGVGKNQNQYTCHVCNIKVLNNDVVNHNKGRKHTANMEGLKVVDYKSEQDLRQEEPEIPGMESVIRKTPLCQTMLDAFTDSPIIGLEYLVELLDKDVENCHVICFLCDKRGESLMQNVRQNIISHMIGTTHRMNYLKRHFPKAHEALMAVQNNKDLKLETGRFVRTVIEGIEKEYGRLKPMIVDGRTFRTRCNEYKELTEKEKHFNETPTRTFLELITPVKREPSVESTGRSPVRRDRRGHSRSPVRRMRSRSPSPFRGARSRSPSNRWNPSPVRGRSPIISQSRSPERRRSPIRRRGQSYRTNNLREESLSLSPEGGSSRMSPFDDRRNAPPGPSPFDEESGQEVVEIHPNQPNGKKTGLNDALRNTTPISNAGSDMSMSPEPLSPRRAQPFGHSRSRQSPHFERSPRLDQYGRDFSKRRRSRSPGIKRQRRRSRSPRRNRRSLSCSPISSRSGSGSPRPMSRTSDNWSHSSKPLGAREKWEKYKRECDLVEKDIKKKRRHYQTQPEKHPAYNDEWKLYWNRKQQEVKESGRNPAKYDYTPEWKVFWNERVEELYIRELQERKRELKKRLSLGEDEGSSRPRSSRGSKSASKGGSVADVKEAWKALTGGDIKEEDKPEPKPIKPSYRTVLGVLRHLTALEPQLGSLGPTVNKLLGKALAMEKVKKESSEDMLADIENTVLLETIMEKFRGQLMAGIVERFNVGATKNAISNISWLLDHAPPPAIQEQILKAEEAPKVAAAEKIINSKVLAPVAATKPAEPKKEAENVTVPGVGNIDRNAIALQIASALLAQGKTDITNDELEQLVEAVVGMAKKKNAEVKEEEKKQEEEQMSKMEEVVTVPDEEETPTDMSEDDLISCLKIFEFLPEHEKHSIIMQLQRLEETDPEKVKELRKFVNAGTEMKSPKQLFGKIDSEEEDYLDSDVLKAAKKNVEQQIKPKAADSKTLQEATDTMMAGLKEKRPDRRSDTINTELPLPPIGNIPEATQAAPPPAAAPPLQNVDPFYNQSQQFNAFQQQAPPYQQYPQYQQYGGPSYGYYPPHQNWAPEQVRPIGFERNNVSMPVQVPIRNPSRAELSRMLKKAPPPAKNLIHLVGKQK